MNNALSIYVCFALYNTAGGKCVCVGIVQARLRELEVERPIVEAAAERAAAELQPLEARLAVVQQVPPYEQ